MVRVIQLTSLLQNEALFFSRRKIRKMLDIQQALPSDQKPSNLHPSSSSTAKANSVSCNAAGRDWWLVVRAQQGSAAVPAAGALRDSSRALLVLPAGPSAVQSSPGTTHCPTAAVCRAWLYRVSTDL